MKDEGALTWRRPALAPAGQQHLLACLLAPAAGRLESKVKVPRRGMLALAPLLYVAWREPPPMLGARGGGDRRFDWLL
jgi:hypothetical protein